MSASSRSAVGDGGRRHRILHVITRLELGGAQHNTLYTVNNLDREAFEVGLAWGPGDRLDVEVEKMSARRFPVSDLVRPIQPRADLGAIQSLRSCIREFAPDVVHTHSSKAGVLGRVAAWAEGIPVLVHSIHGFGFTPLQSPVARAAFFCAEKAVARVTTHFIAVSRPNLDLGIALGLFDRDQVSLIRSGIDLSRVGSAAQGDQVRREFGIPCDAPIVSQVGNFKPQKAPLDFVRVAARVSEVVPHARFVMAGDGPLRGQAETLARDIGIEERVVFCGWRNDIPALLAASTLTVLTSRHEGLPRAVVESLAAGVPVVATRVDGTAEIVQHGANGFLAEAGDVGALAAAVIRLLRRPDERERFARVSRFGLADFDIDMMVRQQEELYRWLLCRNR